MYREDFHRVIAVIIVLVLLLTGIYFFGTGNGRRTYNNWRFGLQKVDDATSYETQKTVEDTCRAMIASFEADKSTYEMYKDSDNEEKQSWAEQAKMRANRTAATYNNYILDNTFIWKGNVPRDIWLDMIMIP